MSTQYIDINAQQSSIIDKTNNNRFTYQLNEGIELPTGTEIAVASSFINKKGITGGSIEIEADISETIHYVYYGIDTDYQTLKQDTHDPTGQYGIDLFTKTNQPVNTLFTGRSWAANNPDSGGDANNTAYTFQRNNIGGTENKMPYVNFVKDNNGFVSIVPMTGKHTILIPKGTYTVTSMAQLIQDQLNGIKLNTDSGEEDFYTFQRRKKTWTGVPVNNVTNRVIQAEESFLPGRTNYTDTTIANGEKNDITFWDAFRQFGNVLPTIGGETPETGLKLFTDQLTLKGTIGAGATGFMEGLVEPLDYTNGTILSAITIQPQHYENIRQGLLTATDADLNANLPNCLNDLYFIYKGEDPANKQRIFANDGANTPCYYQGFCADRNGRDFNVDPNSFKAPATGLAAFKAAADKENPEFRRLAPSLKCNHQLNLFSVGIPIGAQSINIDYSDVQSGFSIGRLHTPRKFPTHDRYGNSSSATAGQEGVYAKRIATGNFIDAGYTQEVYSKGLTPIGLPDAGDTSRLSFMMANTPTGDVGSVYTSINSAVQNFMSRTGGIMIYNWGVNTAKEKGNKVFVNTQTSSLRTFEEFFNSKAEAKLAWAETLWGRLGFSYDQLQDPNNWGEEKWVYNVDGTHKGNGFTTNESVDPSIVTSISTIFNSFNYTKPTTAPTPPGSVNPTTLKNVNIQLFTQLDVNTPANSFNNNAANTDVSDVCVAPYQNSFYTSAVMIPIITKDKPTIADGLPTLSKNGYFLITSNIVSNEDIAKRHDPLAILDVVPVTSLSNQDFITDRNELVHVLSNPKVLNNIDISILNPDLTNPTLNPNSSILLKITKPLPQTTILRQNAEDEIEENIITASVQQQLKQAEGVQSGGKKKTP